MSSDPESLTDKPAPRASNADRRFRTEAKVLRPDASPLSSLVGKLLGRKSEEDEAEPVAASPSPTTPRPGGDRRSTDYERIGAFLERNGLEPTPDHYALAWEYFVAPHSALGWAVDRSIETEGGLSAGTAAVLLEQHRAKLSAEKLTDMIGEARNHIADGSQLVEQTRAHAKAYGTALKSEMNGMAGSTDMSSTVTALTELTQSMIQKTAEAEKQLRTAVRQMGDMQARLAAAEKLAESDALTGLANRRAFEKTLKRTIESCGQSKQPLAVAFCDIDHFKKINDTHGHATGDRVLKYVANLLSKVSNGNCHVARHGGEEFVILLKGRTVEEARDIVDKARADLASRNLTAKDTEKLIGKVSFSAGVAVLEPGGDGSDLLHRADRALYRAKKDGRNRVYL
ncbi:GGDEF domain-containing protein [Sphingomonas cavernae]|nr:GGDEF domain-containing protein [Sphingomonas cavernae]